MSIAEKIYESLKSKIFSGSIRPGDRLFEVEVAKSFNASRTPVREAFRRLEQDFLIERTSQGGVRIPEIGIDAIEDLFKLRTVLECFAIEIACQRITLEQITKLREIKAQAQELLKLDSTESDFVLRRFVELNSAFHDTIYRATGNKFLVRSINNLREILLSMRTMSIQADNACDQSWQEHSLLIEYLSNRDVEAATGLIRTHIKSAYNQLLTVFAKSTPKESTMIETAG